ncbi:MAG: carbon monoxide dehydrogenase medium chain [Chloroflexi bacterium]|nr:carbon monoxide dehydrogenase medium chain [Chloroflexota bacterium]
MKPAPFFYHAPTSVDEAVALLQDLQEEDSKVLAGGQSLMPVLNMRLARVKHLIDINKLHDLDYIRPFDGGLAIGALTRHRMAEHSTDVATRAPLITEALPLVGDRQVRFRGTIGGSIAHADPVAELPTIALALDADLVVSKRGGSRTVPASEFFITFLTTAIEDDELLTEIRIPAPPAHSGHAFLELSRQLGTYAIVSAAAVVALDGGRISEARLALGGVGSTPIRALRAEESLRGQAPTIEAFTEAGRLASEATDPSADVHGSIEYRREMAAVYVRRALKVAAERAAVA